MPTLPLPFIVTFLLALLLLRLLKVYGTQRIYWPFYAFLVMCMFMSALVGLRWTLDTPLLRFIQPIAAIISPPLVWLCFSAAQQGLHKRQWLHVIPFVLLLGALLFWRQGIDAIIVLTYAAYGVAILGLALKPADQWLYARFGSIEVLKQAAFWVSVVLLSSALVDLGVALDFAFYQGEHASKMIAVLHSLAILVIGALIAWMGQSTPPTPEAAVEPINLEPPEISEQRSEPSPAEQKELVARLDTLLREQHWYADPDLSLNRLARRIGVPTRTISAAVNSVLGCNVSQWINAYRVQCVTQQLDTSEQAITEIMGACGFQTKSNFNREFRRLTCMSPSEWRKRTPKTPFALTEAFKVSETP